MASGRSGQENKAEVTQTLKAGSLGFEVWPHRVVVWMTSRKGFCVCVMQFVVYKLGGKIFVCSVMQSKLGRAQHSVGEAVKFPQCDFDLLTYCYMRKMNWWDIRIYL